MAWSILILQVCPLKLCFDLSLLYSFKKSDWNFTYLFWTYIHIHGRFYTFLWIRMHVHSLQTLHCKKSHTDANSHSLVFYLNDILFTTVGIKSQVWFHCQFKQIITDLIESSKPFVLACRREESCSSSNFSKIQRKHNKTHIHVDQINDSNGTFHSRGPDSQ